MHTFINKKIISTPPNSESGLLYYSPKDLEFEKNIQRAVSSTQSPVLEALLKYSALLEVSIVEMQTSNQAPSLVSKYEFQKIGVDAIWDAIKANKCTASSLRSMARDLPLDAHLADLHIDSIEAILKHLTEKMSESQSTGTSSAGITKEEKVWIGNKLISNYKFYNKTPEEKHVQVRAFKLAESLGGQIGNKQLSINIEASETHLYHMFSRYYPDYQDGLWPEFIITTLDQPVRYPDEYLFKFPSIAVAAVEKCLMCELLPTKTRTAKEAFDISTRVRARLIDVAEHVLNLYAKQVGSDSDIKFVQKFADAFKQILNLANDIKKQEEAQSPDKSTPSYDRIMAIELQEYEKSQHDLVAQPKLELPQKLNLEQPQKSRLERLNTPELEQPQKNSKLERPQIGVQSAFSNFNTSSPRTQTAVTHGSETPGKENVVNEKALPVQIGKVSATVAKKRPNFRMAKGPNTSEPFSFVRTEFRSPSQSQSQSQSQSPNVEVKHAYKLDPKATAWSPKNSSTPPQSPLNSNAKVPRTPSTESSGSHQSVGSTSSFSSSAFSLSPTSPAPKTQKVDSPDPTRSKHGKPFRQSKHRSHSARVGSTQSRSNDSAHSGSNQPRSTQSRQRQTRARQRYNDRGSDQKFGPARTLFSNSGLPTDTNGSASFKAKKSQKTSGSKRTRYRGSKARVTRKYGTNLKRSTAPKGSWR